MRAEVVVLLGFCLGSVYSLECYVCTRQEYNTDKCTSTVNTCLKDQNACISLVQWRYPPYWTPNGDRIYYITKACDTRDDCERKRNNGRTHCKRDWWNDWSCYDCCNGDRCNFYVTMGAGSQSVHLPLIIGAAVTVLGAWKSLLM